MQIFQSLKYNEISFYGICGSIQTSESNNIGGKYHLPARFKTKIRRALFSTLCIWGKDKLSELNWPIKYGSNYKNKPVHYFVAFVPFNIRA